MVHAVDSFNSIEETAVDYVFRSGTPSMVAVTLDAAGGGLSSLANAAGSTIGTVTTTYTVRDFFFILYFITNITELSTLFNANK